MQIIEMFVGLKIPDTTAITALKTLQKMGLKEIKDIIRENYYKFYLEGGIKKFKNEISKVDIIVNANKNYYKFDKEKNSPVASVSMSKLMDKSANFFRILVKDVDNGTGLLNTLRSSLGFSNVKKVENGILWSLEIKGNKREIAKKAAEELLVNENYQIYEVYSQTKIIIQ